METNAQYFDCLCRTCMNKVEASSHDGSTIPPQQWLSIFDTIEECGELRIAELLSDAVPQIVVQPGDELPKKICSECRQRLLSVYRFQQMCLQSDKQMHELLSKEQTVLKTPMLEGALKGETETNDADSEPLKELRCSSTLHNLQQPSIQEALAEVTVQTFEPEAAQSSADDHLQDNTQLLEQCMDAQGEFEEFIKNEPNEGDKAKTDKDTTHLKTPVLEEAIKGGTETNDAETQALKELRCSSTLHNLQQPSIQEALAEVTVQTIEPEAVQSSAEHLQDNTQLLEQCNDSQGEFEEFIKNEPIEDDEEANSEYSDGDTMHSTISVTKEEVLPIEFEDQQVNDSIPAEQRTTHAEDKPYECPYCPLRFRSKGNASRHKAVVHEGAAKQYECDICGTKWRHQSALKSHKLIHSKEKRYKCDLCEKRFVQRQELQVHIRTHTGEKPYKCKYCEHTFAAFSTLHYHLRSHLGKNSHRCKLCPLAFRSNAEMRLHFTSHKNEDPEVRERNLKALQDEEAKLVLKFSKDKSKRGSREEQQRQKLSNKEIEQRSTDILAEPCTTHIKDKPYECPHCPLRFNSKSSVWIHKAVHKKAKGHQCDICGKVVKTRPSLIQHKLIHSKDKRYKCDFCEKRFTHMAQLQVHIRTHTGETPFKCKYCERGFSTYSALNYHLRSHLGENIHRCKFCPLAFPSSVEMRLHLTSHKNENPEVREQNLKALQEEEAKLVLKFSIEKSKGQSTEEQQQQKLFNKDIEQPSTENLAEPCTTHIKDKPYRCPHCPLRFNSESSVWIHKAVHKKAKRHECDICGKVFKTRPRLIQHKLIHSKDKRYKCDFCEKRFTHMAHLQVHIRTHTGEKPFKCKYCERGFSAYGALNYHLRSHLGENIYRCKICPLAFPSSVEMHLHLTSHKNENPEVREQNLKALQEEEAKLVLKFSKEKSKGQSTEEQQRQKLSNKEIEQPSTDIFAEQRTTHTEDKPFECPYCPLRFISKKYASKHKTTHEGIKRHKCSICGKKFRQKCSLIVHERIHSKERPHKCDQCEKRFTHMQQLQIHMRTHTGEKPYKCKYCERCFVSSSLLSSHLHRHLGKNIHKCNFCPLAFPLAVEMRLHLTSHRNEDPEVRERNLKALQEEEVKIKLKISKETSKGQSTEEQQQEKFCNKEIEQQSTDSSQHSCHLCNKSYKRREYLTRHLNYHKMKANNSKVYCYACHLCSESYKTQQYLTIHLNLAHSVEPQRYTCDVCNKSFASSSGLREHIRTHTAERPNVSPECGKSFTAQSIPAEQRTTHAEDKPYECPYCPLRFSSKRYASIHQTIHEGIKPHKCGICGKKFRQTSDLRRHTRIHSKKRQHKCDLCEKQFTEMQNLKIHIRTHTGERPYKCKYCESGFASHSLLNYHLRNHLGENIHRCKFCPLAFPSSAEMRLHFTSHKNEDPEVRERNLKALQEEEAKLKLKFSKEISKGQSTEDQQQEKLSDKDIEQPSRERGEFEEFIKEERAH